MFTSGFLWYSTQDLNFSERIHAAITRYEEKFHSSPNLIFVSIEEYDPNLVIENITIRPLKTVHGLAVWLGHNEVSIQRTRTFTLIGGEIEDG